MSVHYSLNKKIKIKDLKAKGFEIETSNKADEYPIIIGSHNYYKKGSWVGVLYLHKYNNIDDVETSELEGHTGYAVIKEICDVFGCKFLTDTYIDDVIYAEGKEHITEEDFDNCMKSWEELGKS